MSAVDQTGPLSALAWFGFIAGMILLVGALMWLLDRLEDWVTRPPLPEPLPPCAVHVTRLITDKLGIEWLVCDHCGETTRLTDPRCSECGQAIILGRDDDTDEAYFRGLMAGRELCPEHAPHGTDWPLGGDS